LNALPVPQYRDYFAKIAAAGLGEQIAPSLLMESARGCWWGAKHHCVFCGLNGDTIAFRSKSPERVIDELRTLLARYPVERVDFVDNILDMRYVNTVFPRLRDEGPHTTLFFEVKANLRYDQLRIMYDGGVRSIQPGIESLDDGVLRIMDKGCTAFQNIQLLRWCAELGVEVAWNVIGGFPGEDPAAYEAMAELIPLLTHLPAPMTCSPIRLDRFSPLYMRSQQFALRRVRPTHAYYFVYPLDRRELENLAYFFEFEHADGRKPPEYIEHTSKALAPWWTAKKLPPEEQPALDAVWAGDRLELRDTRACACAPEHVLTGLAAELYDRCDVAQTLANLIESQRAQSYPADDVIAALGELVAKRLMSEMNGRYLSLAVFRVRRAAGRAAAENGRHDEAETAHQLLPAV
jgi:ribosomal peptide maturation radical SAM protein 1